MTRELLLCGSRVTLLEDPSQRAATAVAAGLLQLAGGRISSAHLQLRRACWDAYPAFLESLGLELSPGRHVRLAKSFSSAEGFASTLRGLDIDVHTLSATEFQEQGLTLHGLSYRGAVMMEAGRVEPDVLMEVLERELERLGCERAECRVVRLERHGVVDAQERLWRGDAVVLACGAGMPELWSPEWSFRLEPGEVCVFEGEATCGLSVEAPWSGQLLVPNGSGWRSVAGAESLLGFSGRVLWRAAAVRAFAPDGLPIAGQVREGVYVLGGLGRNGLLTAPLLAQALVKNLNHEPTPDWFKNFAPDRSRIGERRVWSP